MGLLSSLFGSYDPEIEKNRKFKEIESQFEGDKEMMTSSKASWLTSRGNRFGEQEKLDLAVNDFKEAISLKPDFTPAHIALGIAYRQKGLLNEALETLKKAPEKMTILGRELTIHEFQLYQILASVYLLMGEKSKTIEYAKRAIEVADSPERREQLEFAIEAGVIDQAEDDSEMQEILRGLIQEIEGASSQDLSDTTNKPVESVQRVIGTAGTQESEAIQLDEEEESQRQVRGINFAGMFCRLAQDSIGQATMFLEEGRECFDDDEFEPMLGIALIQAAQQGQTAAVLALLEAGADVNAKDEEGLSALIVSASAGHEAIVNELLKRGADPNYGNERVNSLATATGRGHVAIVSALLQSGADPNLETANEVTPLLLAVVGGKTAIAQPSSVRELMLSKRPIVAQLCLWKPPGEGTPL